MRRHTIQGRCFALPALKFVLSAAVGSDRLSASLRGVLENRAGGTTSECALLCNGVWVGARSAMYDGQPCSFSWPDRTFDVTAVLLHVISTREDIDLTKVLTETPLF